LQRSGNGLAHVDVARHHCAINGSVDGGVVQIRLRHLDRRLFLVDLGACLLFLGQRSRNLSCRAIGVRLCYIERLLADYSLPGESQIALVVGFRLHLAGLGSVRYRNRQICLGVLQVRLCL